MIIVGDLHFTNKEPFHYHIINFLKWLIEHFSDQIIIFLGDLFDVSSPHNDLRAEIIPYLKKFREVHILQGNHDYSKLKGSVLSPLQHYPNIFIYNSLNEVRIENYNCLMLPFIYTDMKEKYENLDISNIDYIFTHITPLECAFGNEGIDLKITGTYIHGHTHLQKTYKDKRNNSCFVIGVPVATKHLEDKQNHQILEIRKDQFGDVIVKHEIPEKLKLNYETIKFGEEPKSKNSILNIINAPDVNLVYEQYKNYYIRESGIELKRTELNSELNQFSIESEKEKFIEFAKKESISQEIVDICISYLDKEN